MRNLFVGSVVSDSGSFDELERQGTYFDCGFYKAASVSVGLHASATAAALSRDAYVIKQADTSVGVLRILLQIARARPTHLVPTSSA